MPPHSAVLTLLVALFVASEGAQARGGRVQTGLASFYGTAHEGKRMANGQPFRAAALTAASLSFPLGTPVRVCRTGLDRCVRVIITDRGPYGRGRVIDLSYAAARALGALARGLVRVTITEDRHG